MVQFIGICCGLPKIQELVFSLLSLLLSEKYENFDRFSYFTTYFSLAITIYRSRNYNLSILRSS